MREIERNCSSSSGERQLNAAGHQDQRSVQQGRNRCSAASIRSALWTLRYFIASENDASPAVMEAPGST